MVLRIFYTSNILFISCGMAITWTNNIIFHKNMINYPITFCNYFTKYYSPVMIIHAINNARLHAELIVLIMILKTVLLEALNCNYTEMLWNNWIVFILNNFSLGTNVSLNFETHILITILSVLFSYLKICFHLIWNTCWVLPSCIANSLLNKATKIFQKRQ